MADWLPKQLPEDPEAERSLLCTLCSPGYEQVAAGITPMLCLEDFVVPRHKSLFKALCHLLDRAEEVSPLTLKVALEELGEMNRLGGYPQLIELLAGEEVGRPIVLVRVLQEKRQARELIRMGARLVREAAEGQKPMELIERVGSGLSALACHSSRKTITPVADLSDNALATLVDRMEGRREASWFAKDYSRVNGMFQGFQAGRLYVLAARPAVGKTAFALNLALAVSAYHAPVAFFSLEMSSEEVWTRLAASHARVDTRAMVEARDYAALDRLNAAKEELDTRAIWIQDRASITPREIVADVDRVITRMGKPAFVVVDYLGLISSPADKGKTEADRIGDITRGLKLLAKDRNLPVLLLSQLNREVEHRQGGRPQLSDLRSSGSTEQDADVVMFLHRNQDTTELIVAKHRNGPTGTIPFRFRPEWTLFEEIDRYTEERPLLQKASGGDLYA